MLISQIHCDIDKNIANNKNFVCRLQRHILLVLWTILMSVFTLMAFMIPDDLKENHIFTFFNASGAIQPDFLGYWRGAYRPVLYTFGIFHLILSIWMVLEYFIITWPNFRLPSMYYSLRKRYMLTHKYFVVGNGI